MFLLSVFLIGCFSQVSLVASTAKLNLGCTFDDDNYFKAPESQTVLTIPYSSRPAFSTQPLTNLNFMDLGEAKKFLDIVNSARDEYFKSVPYNNLDIFLKFYKGFEEWPLDDLTNYYNEYQEEYAPHSTGASRVIGVFNRIAEEYPEAANHMFLGATSSFLSNATLAELYKASKNKKNTQPLSSLQYDRVVGFIKIAYQRKRKGYILVDMGTHDQVKCPVLMMDSKALGGGKDGPEFSTEFTDGKDTVSFSLAHDASLENPDNVYILAKQGSVVHGTYVGRSICSFVQSISKKNLLDPVKRIYIPGSVSLIFDISKQSWKSNAINVTLAGRSPVEIRLGERLKNISQTDKAVLDEVEEIIPELRGKLMDKLKKLGFISIVDHDVMIIMNEKSTFTFSKEYLSNVTSALSL